MPLRGPRARAWGAGLGGLVAVGCAGVVHTTAQPALEEGSWEIRRVAVAPLRPGAGGPGGPERAELAADLIGRYLAEALSEQGLEVVAPSDVARALGFEERTARLDPRETSRRASAKLGAQGLLLGEVRRFRGRQGQALGSQRPASVAFRVTLYGAPDGTPLWSAIFDQTQRPLFADLANLFRYPGAGTRWLTAEEMARWGAREVARALPAKLNTEAQESVSPRGSVSAGD